MKRVSAPGTPSINCCQVLVETNSLMPSNLPWAWPSSASPNSLDYGILVHFQTGKITASNLSQWRRTSSHDHNPQVHISTLDPSQAPSASTMYHDHRFPVRTFRISKCIHTLAHGRSCSASLCSLDHGLQEYLQIPSITASKCNSTLGWVQPNGVCLSSLHHHFQAQLE
jgi:hypothetical protein